MDLTTTTQLLGNIGEFFGAIAVVATLGYLAVQIRQSGRATTVGSEQRRQEATLNLLLMPVQNEGLREAIQKTGGMTPHYQRAAAVLTTEFGLDETEAHQFAMYWGAFFGVWEEYYRNPFRDDQRWQAVTRRIHVNLTAGHAQRYVWDEISVLYDREFVAHVNRLLDGANP